MRKLLIPLLLLLCISCASYTIADGRANIVMPEETNLPSTKLSASSSASSLEAYALIIQIGNETISQEDLDSAIAMTKDIAPDFVVLIGSADNQRAFRSHFSNVYELDGTTIILSDRPYNTETIELYIANMPAILAKTEFPILTY